MVDFLHPQKMRQGHIRDGVPLHVAAKCCPLCWLHCWCVQILGVFDQSLELWTGRVAMLGLVGLVAAEVVKGDAFF